MLPLTGLLLAACAAPPGSEPVPPPPELAPIEAPEPPPPAPTEATVPRRVGESFPPSSQQGMFPGRESAGDSFEQGLQKRRQRVDLGLDRPEQEQAPVDNVLDLGF
ncbi:MAG: hypothetical protein R3202_08130 [Candidatus Competibacterales bacterium]|nr:hypothetical protein [Candidatus Competibacterales bacterium]